MITTQVLRPIETDLVGRVRRYYELVDSGDIDGLVGLFAPHAVYHRPGYQPLVGHGDLRRFYQSQRVIDAGAHTLTRIVADGYDVAVNGEFAGVLRDGRQVRLRFADFFTLTPDLAFERRDTFFFAPLV
jgi:ketosteroid isomerase-like protein